MLFLGYQEEYKETSSISITFNSFKRQKKYVFFFRFVDEMNAWLVSVEKHHPLAMVVKFSWEGVMASKSINMTLSHTDPFAALTSYDIPKSLSVRVWLLKEWQVKG